MGKNPAPTSTVTESFRTKTDGKTLNIEVLRCLSHYKKTAIQQRCLRYSNWHEII